MSKSVFLPRSTSEAGDHLDSIASEKKLSIAGPLRSAYTPKLALSLTVRTPNFAKSPMELSDPPLVVGGGSSAMFMAVATVFVCNKMWEALPPKLSLNFEVDRMRHPGYQIPLLLLRSHQIGQFLTLTRVS